MTSLSRMHRSIWRFTLVQFYLECLGIPFSRQNKQDCQDKKCKEIVTMQVHPVNHKILSFLDLNKIIFCNSSRLRRVISNPPAAGEKA